VAGRVTVEVEIGTWIVLYSEENMISVGVEEGLDGPRWSSIVLALGKPVERQPD
jgi:hypothetical protein